MLLSGSLWLLSDEWCWWQLCSHDCSELWTRCSQPGSLPSSAASDVFLGTGRNLVTYSKSSPAGSRTFLGEGKHHVLGMWCVQGCRSGGMAGLRNGGCLEFLLLQRGAWFPSGMVLNSPAGSYSIPLLGRCPISLLGVPNLPNSPAGSTQFPCWRCPVPVLGVPSSRAGGPQFPCWRCPIPLLGVPSSPPGGFPVPLLGVPSSPLFHHPLQRGPAATGALVPNTALLRTGEGFSTCLSAFLNPGQCFSRA